MQTTFPRRLEDNPAYHNWPGENLKVVYGEGLYIGYRHYERLNIAPLFPFGHGLSYTTFSYGKPSINSRTLTDSSKITITLAVANSGSVAGAEIVQAYIHDKKSSLPRPEKELQAFTKVFLEAGETKHVALDLDKYSVGFYDTNQAAWVAEEGVFDVLIGSSSQDIRYVVPYPYVREQDNLTLSLGRPSHLRSRNRSRGYFSISLLWEVNGTWHMRRYTAGLLYLLNVAPCSRRILCRT